MLLFHGLKYYKIYKKLFLFLLFHVHSNLNIIYFKELFYYHIIIHGLKYTK